MIEQLNWLGFAVTGKEFVAMDDLRRFGIDHWRGVRIEFERRGKQRTAEPHEYPAIHNYIWIRPTKSQVQHLSSVRFLGSTFHILNAHGVRQFRRFGDEVEAEEAKARAIIAQQEEAKRIADNMALKAETRKQQLAAKRASIAAAMNEYKAGEMIEIRDGVFAGELARFRKLCLGAADVHPFIEAEIEMMGRIATVQIDPLTVRRAVNG